MRKHAFISVLLTAIAGWLYPAEIANAQAVSQDPNFTPSVLASGLSAPSGVAFRAPTGDLVVAQTGASQVSVVKISNGSVKALASQTSPYEVSVRSSDGLAAVTLQSANRSNDQIDFYNSSGTLVGTIYAGTSFGETAFNCLSGTAFDNSGNLFVAAGFAFEGPCSNWQLYEFAGPIPYNGNPGSFIVDFFENDVIEGVAFNATPLPCGSLYAVSSSANGSIDEVVLCGGDGPVLVVAGSAPPESPALSSVAVDPLLGDVYITQGSQILRMPPPQPVDSEAGPVTPTLFASGLSNTFGISFDISGNLYVNDTAAGNLLVFARNASASPIQPVVQGQLMTFTNPAITNQVQTIFIPQSALLNGARYMNVVFVPTLATQLNSRLLAGSTGDINFFGGGPIPAGSTCVPVPFNSNPPNCLVVVQKCYDLNVVQQPLCTEQEPAGSPDLILLTTTYSDSSPGVPAGHFAIDFDTPSDNNSATDITIKTLDCCTGKGGTKGTCSQTYFFVPAPSSSPDFSLNLGLPNPITINSAMPNGSFTVQLNSLPANVSGFNGGVNLSVADVPPGISATFTQTPVNLSSGGSGNSTLNVSVGPGFDVAPTTASIATLVANLLASGCINNSGIANALTSKLSAAQAAINAGQNQTAINALSAFKNQVAAQAGKHIGTSCTVAFTMVVKGTAVIGFTPVTHMAAANVNVTAFNAASALAAAASALIGTLPNVIADPIMGFVTNGGVAVPGAMVSILKGNSTVLGPVPTDVTGFYYFAPTGGLTNGTGYNLKVTTLPAGFSKSNPSSQSFTWGHNGLAFNFMIY